MKRLIFMITPVLIFLLAFRPGYQHTVKGLISGEDGAPLAGVNVTVKGGATQTISGDDGTYTIIAPGKTSTLVFSHVGYTTQSVRLSGQTTLNITLKTTGSELDEVVVVGYGSEKKRIANELSGRAAGVQVQPNHRMEAPLSDYPREIYNTEGYDYISENGFRAVRHDPLSTFSIDVDAASYSNVRRMLNSGQLPPAGAVRIEEMINYFKYDYDGPVNNDPFAIHTEISDAPWNSKHKLVLIGLQGKRIPTENLPASNLTFLIDVSGSMEDPNKLGLVKSSLKMLTEQLRPQDRVSIVVYAGAAGLVLPPTPGNQKAKIIAALENLSAGGSTAGGQGIRLAYKTAKENFVKEGNNRVILCTDGDFNVGESSDDAMERMIEQERKSGVYLTVLGYGMGNYKDNKMQKLADKGNGNHAYIDGISEARKVLVSEFGGTMFTIAQDVKLQIEFNPAKVAGYRLIGYENRMLAKEDFNDDRKDAGELGSGHTVTALYELIPVGVKSSFMDKISVDELKYSGKQNIDNTVAGDDLLTVKFRYKDPGGETSKLIEHPLKNKSVPIHRASENFRFAASVAEFGMLLRKSEFKGEASFEQVIERAGGARGIDREGYRAEFIRLVEAAGAM